MKILKNSYLKMFLIIASLLMVLAACSGSSDEASGEESAQNNDNSEEIVLEAVSFLPVNNPGTATLEDWINRVEEATEGRVKINWRGGPDVIPSGEQFGALTSNVVDITFGFVGQYQSQLPESLALALSEHTPWEERENGYYEFMVEQHTEIGVQYLGRWLTGSPRIWLNEPIEKVEELNNKVIRATPNYQRFFDELGISSSMIDQADVYTSLQTGVVEGFVNGTLFGPRTEGWTDSTKYVLDVPFWTQNCVILMNSSKWDTISKEDQEAIINATAEYEKEMVKYYEDLEQEERNELEQINVEFIKFADDAEEEKFLEIAYEVEWDFIAEQVEADALEKIRELASK